MNDWYVITNADKDVFVGQDENGGVKMTMFLPSALIGPYAFLEMFIKLNIDEDARKILHIRKIKLV